MVLPNVPEGPGWVTLTSSIRRSLVVDTPVNLGYKDRCESGQRQAREPKRRQRLPKTCMNDKPVGLSQGHRNLFSRAYTAPRPVKALNTSSSTRWIVVTGRERFRGFYDQEGFRRIDCKESIELKPQLRPKGQTAYRSVPTLVTDLT